MHEITAVKLVKYEKGIKAQTYMNVMLKKKSFNAMAHYGFRKKMLRVNETALVARNSQKTKFKVLSEIYKYKEGQKKKVNNLKAATRFVKQMRIKRSFASLKMNLIRAALGKQVASMREQKTLEKYFVKWLALANQSLKDRHQILSSRNSANGDDLDDIGGLYLGADHGDFEEQNVQSPLMVDEKQLFSDQKETSQANNEVGSSLQRKNQMSFPSSKGTLQRKNLTDFDNLSKFEKPQKAGIIRKDQMQFSSQPQADLKQRDQLNLQDGLPIKSSLQRKNQTDFNNSKTGSKFSTLQKRDQMPEEAKSEKGSPKDEFKSMSSSKKDEFQSMSSYSN